MTLVACVPYSGFVPGQSIPLTIELDNNSNVAIDAVKVKLERVRFLMCSIIHMLFVNLFLKYIFFF